MQQNSVLPLASLRTQQDLAPPAAGLRRRSSQIMAAPIQATTPIAKYNTFQADFSAIRRHDKNAAQALATPMGL